MTRVLDIDAIVGYDYGMFRLEAEAGFKSLRADRVDIDDSLADEFDLIDSDFDLDDSGSVLSVMVNGLLDIGNDDIAAYVGGGVGMARVKFAGQRDSSFGWQLIAGVRKAISPRMDIGLKYRYFRTSKLNFSDEFDDGGTVFGINSEGKLRTHSLLASLIFNLAPVPLPPGPPPPPLPPPPPATQICYDGSVILATDVCPQPPAPPVYVPPPPPEPMPERG